MFVYVDSIVNFASQCWNNFGRKGWKPNGNMWNACSITLSFEAFVIMVFHYAHNFDLMSGVIFVIIEVLLMILHKRS
jgi:hypothetical protein